MLVKKGTPITNMKEARIIMINKNNPHSETISTHIPVHPSIFTLLILPFGKFVFAYYPGGHLSVFFSDYRRNGIQFLQQKYNEWREKNGSN